MSKFEKTLHQYLEFQFLKAFQETDLTVNDRRPTSLPKGNCLFVKKKKSQFTRALSSQLSDAYPTI